MTRVRVGTSGWSYRDWVGPLYPAGTDAGEYLETYARSFTAVEVDSTFYGIPRRSTVEKWAQATPPGFLLVPKVPGVITHGTDARRIDVDRVLRDEAGQLDVFLETLEPLGEKLGPVIFQLPYFRVGALDVRDFLERLARILDRVPGEVRAAVEVRNKNWVTTDYLTLLEKRGAAAVMVDHPYMPPPLHQLRVGMVTADFAFIRLLGDRRAVDRKTKTWDRTVVDRGNRLADWAEVIDAISRDAGLEDVFVFANNHFAGHGPATCCELAAKLRERGVDPGPTAPENG